MDTRTKDGVSEHRHTGCDYWHPAARLHNLHHAKMHGFDVEQVIWGDESEECINGIVDALHFNQDSYVDMKGAEVIMRNPLWRMSNVGTPEWFAAVSIAGVQVDVIYRSGKVSRMRLSSYRSGVDIVRRNVQYDRNCPLHDAKQLIESGLAGMYIDNPTLMDAMHILHVSDISIGARHYDLVRLPNGMHVPVDVLEEEYGVSWETMARIPMGEPRDDCTFRCPMCGDKSYYAGVCISCDEGDRGSVAYLFRLRYTKDVDECRKHEEVSRIIESDDWVCCRYMNGSDQSM